MIIVFIFLVAASLALLGYAYLRRAPVEREKDSNADTASQPDRQKVLAENVISAVPSFNGQRVWYLTANGKIFSVNLETDAREEFVLPDTLPNPTGVLWQEKGSDLVVEQNLGGHIRYIYIDARTRQLAAYPDNIRTPVILAGDTRIAYDWVSAEKHELKVSDISGSNFSAIGDLFRPDYTFVASPRKQEIVMFAAASSSPLVHVDLEKKAFKNLAAEGEYVSAKFSPDGSKLLIEEANQGQKVFWVYDFAAGQTADLDIREARFALWARDSGGVMFGSQNALQEASLGSTELKNWSGFPDGEVKAAFLHPFQDTLFYIDGTDRLISLPLNVLDL